MRRPPTHPVLAFMLAIAAAAAPLAGGASAQDASPAPSPVATDQSAAIEAELTKLVAPTAAPTPLLDADTIAAIAGSPVGRALAYLVTQYLTNPAVAPAFNAVVDGLADLPVGYSGNPWKAAATGEDLVRLMVDELLAWGVFLPQIEGDQDNGLYYIERIAWLWYHNEAGEKLILGTDPVTGQPLDVLASFMEQFNDQRGQFMWSPESASVVAEWIDDPRIEIEDYQLQDPADYASFNDFFAREITVDEDSQTIPSRPATMPIDQYPERDYIVAAPTDCIMNPLVQQLTIDAQPVRVLVDNPLQHNTVIDVKGVPISVDRLLGSLEDDIKATFVGGTGLSCVLMPNTYHHFHAPVNGTVVHAEVVETHGTYGIYDFPNWAPDSGSVGRPGTDFSDFEVFQRGVIVIEVHYQDVDGHELTGYVASIPVGLATIGSVVLDGDVKPGLEVKRGYTRLGNFYYGGSLDILLFSKGLAAGAIQTRLGNQIAIFDIGSSPPVD